MTIQDQERSPNWQPAHPSDQPTATATATADKPGEGAHARTRTPPRIREGAAAVWVALRTPISKGAADGVDRAAPTVSPAGQAAHLSFWREGPASLADIWAYLAAEERAPAEKGFGYLVTIPATLPLYILIYIFQRWERVVVAASLWGIISLFMWLNGIVTATPLPAPGAGP